MIPHKCCGSDHGKQNSNLAIFPKSQKNRIHNGIINHPEVKNNTYICKSILDIYGKLQKSKQQ